MPYNTGATIIIIDELGQTRRWVSDPETAFSIARELLNADPTIGQIWVQTPTGAFDVTKELKRAQSRVSRTVGPLC